MQTLEWPDPQAASGQAAAAFYRIPTSARLADADAGKPYNGRSEFQAFSDAACKTPAEEDDPSALFIRAFLIVAPAGE